MRLLLPLLFFGINAILCGLSAAVDEEFHFGSDIIVERDTSSFKNDKKEDSPDFKTENSSSWNLSELTEQQKINLNENTLVTSRQSRWPDDTDESKLKILRRKKQPLPKDEINLPKLNHKRRVKVRRKKIKNRENSEPTDIALTATEIKVKLPNIKNGNSTNKIKTGKSRKSYLNSTGKFIEIQNTGKNEPQQMLKKRKSHRNGKKRRKIVSHEQLPSDSSSLSGNAPMGGLIMDTNSLSYENPLHQVDQQQNQDWKNSEIQMSEEKENKENSGHNGNDGDDGSVRSITGGGGNQWQEKMQRLAAREEKRKLLQAKRELRRKRKMERMERRKRKGFSRISTADEKTLSQVIDHKKESESIKSHLNEHFMAQPSIDYFVEKPSNYFDTNDTPTFGIIGVSVESPSKNIASAETEEAEMLEKLPTPSGSTNMGEIMVVEKGEENNRIGGDGGGSGGDFQTKNIESLNTDDDTNYNNNNSNRKAIITLSQQEESSKDDDGGYSNDEKTTVYGDGGDLSCLRDDFQPAPQVSHADVKYLRNEIYGVDKAFLEVEYICHHGYKMQFNGSKKSVGIYCKNGQWIGIPPTCVHSADMTDFNETCNYPERCEQLCSVRNGLEKCTCHRGFRMKNNRCEDINECAENTSVCEFGCVNTVGSYHCKCPKGLRVGDANSCIDINECLLRNGHGPCQDTCINTWGSYKCSCDSLPGSQLSIDGHSCTDIDECSINNGGCSHTCLNTMGRAFCLCPEGWTLDKDWKTCVDIDECAEHINDSSEQRCEFGCINTPGSYSCLVDFGSDQPIEEDNEEEDGEINDCADGLYHNTTSGDCQDINECSENNGGCSHYCINTIGSYHCTCRPGFHFASDKFTCVVSNSSSNISCPALFPPKHGYLECSRPISIDIPDSNSNGYEGQHRITNRPGSQCVLRCPTGFRINGKFSKHCSDSGEWIGDSDGTCIRYPKPKLICPSDIVLEPPPNETMAKLRIPRPKTDVNYDRDVSVSPDWFRNSEIALEVGIRNVTYTARHPVSKLTVSCSFKVKVLEGEPPVVKFCPQTQKYTLTKQHESIKIAWNEPIFTDNVNVTQISRTNSPGNSFGVGSHQIVYVAKDEAGHEAKCIFKILVNVPYRPMLNHPLPIYHMFYK